MEKEIARKMLPSRKRNSHKGTYGKAAIVAGGEKYTGAAYLSTAACLRSGAGYTALFTPKGVLSYYVLKAPEALLIPSNDGGMFEFNKETFDSLLSYDAIAYGMGMGASEEVFKGAEYLLKEYKGKLILDADALNALALHREAIDELFANKKCEVVLTPHLGEFSRLTGKSVEDISKDGIFVAQSFAKKLGASILLKNAVSVITDGDRVAMNATGNSGQAKGGSGDVLSGVIAGLCASGAGVFDGAACGAYLVGNAAEIAAREIGEYSLLATDVIARLGKAFLGITENADKRGNEQ